MDSSVQRLCNEACPANRISERIEFKVHSLDEDEIKSYDLPSSESGSTTLIIPNSYVKKMTIKTVPMISISEGIGFIGGYLGLFVGVSIISVIELLELFIDLVLAKFRYLRSPVSSET